MNEHERPARMITRIYRTQRGWVIDQRTLSGERTRTQYPTGQAAMAALDPRNRQPMARRTSPQVLLEAFASLFAAPVYIVHEAIQPGEGKAAFRRAFPHLTGETR